MQADVWKELLRRIPAEQMDNLMLPAAAGSAAPGLLARGPSRSEIIQRLRLRTEARDGANSPSKE